MPKCMFSSFEARSLLSYLLVNLQIFIQNVQIIKDSDKQNLISKVCGSYSALYKEQSRTTSPPSSILSMAVFDLALLASIIRRLF